MATRKPLYLDLTYGAPTEASSTDALSIGQYIAVGVSGVAFQGGGNLISGIADPQAATDAATKGYADRIAQGISLIPSVTAMSNANVPLTGLQTIDGVSLTAGSRVLLTAQNNPVQNGVWIVASGSWSRPTLADDYVTGRQFAGLFTYVEAGGNFGSEQWAAVGAGAGKVDTDGSTWSQLTGAAEIVAGSGLAKSAVNGNTLSVVLASNSGLQFTGNGVDTLLASAGGVKKDASGLALNLSANNTLAVDANGLRVLGVPSQFTVAGTATQNTVSATSLNTLTAGTSSLADGLHNHTNVLQAQAVVGTYSNGSAALAAGDPVQWGSTADTLARCDAAAGSTSLCMGVALGAIAANATGPVLRRGIATGVISQATPGTPYYLNVGGGLTSTIPTAPGSSVLRVGLAKNANDLEVNPILLTVRSAS